VVSNLGTHKKNEPKNGRFVSTYIAIHIPRDQGIGRYGMGFIDEGIGFMEFSVSCSLVMSILSIIVNIINIM
jgi:hypothetical protein